MSKLWHVQHCCSLLLHNKSIQTYQLQDCSKPVIAVDCPMMLSQP